MVQSTQMDGFQTYVKLGGLLQYLLHYKSDVVEVLLFPGSIMEDIGQFNSQLIHKVMKMYVNIRKMQFELKAIDLISK